MSVDIDNFLNLSLREVVGGMVFTVKEPLARRVALFKKTERLSYEEMWSRVPLDVTIAVCAAVITPLVMIGGLFYSLGHLCIQDRESALMGAVFTVASLLVGSGCFLVGAIMAPIDFGHLIYRAAAHCAPDVARV